MGRKSQSRRLVVWMNGEMVGTWDVKPNSTSEFSYASAWLDSPRKRPVSLSMPLRPATAPYQGAQVDAFFDNLLPDSHIIRARLCARFHAGSAEAFDLLEHIGRDCVGAVQLLPDEMQPTDLYRIQGTPLSTLDIVHVLDDCLSSTPFFEMYGEDTNNFRIALAGAQEKTALLKVDGQWMRPIGPTPTTHMLKLPLGTGKHGTDQTSSVDNEWLCARILAAFGLEVANSQVLTFGQHTVLEVERFDRQFSEDNSWIMRLPQEDFCQVTGTPGQLKYEVDGGPGIAVIMKKLLGSVVAEQDRMTFLRTQILFWLLCATDGHAKNFSVFLLSNSRFRLTPSYDVLSAYPALGTAPHQLSPSEIKLAMAVGGDNKQCQWSDIGIEHWAAIAQECGLGAKFDAMLDELIASVPTALDAAAAQLPAGYPAHIADSIFNGVRQSAKKLNAHR